MAKKKTLEEMTAKELFELARQREQQEQEAQREAQQKRLEALREKRKTLITEHKKALTTIDREIKKLGGKQRSAGRSRGRSEITRRIMETLEKNSPMNSAQLREQLQNAGLETKYLGQQLAQLKRQGKVTSPGRGIYAIVS